MSAWRRRAIELFSDLRRDFEAKDATIHTVFFELLSRCHEAHKRGDIIELKKIYGFASWCHRQNARDLSNAADVSFYEHLADNRVTSREIPYWVEPDIFEDVMPLLEWRIGEEDAARLRKNYEEARKHPFKEPKWPPSA